MVRLIQKLERVMSCWTSSAFEGDVKYAIVVPGPEHLENAKSSLSIGIETAFSSPEPEENILGNILDFCDAIEKQCIGLLVVHLTRAID